MTIDCPLKTHSFQQSCVALPGCGAAFNSQPYHKARQAVNSPPTKERLLLKWEVC